MSLKFPHIEQNASAPVSEALAVASHKITYASSEMSDRISFFKNQLKELGEDFISTQLPEEIWETAPEKIFAMLLRACGRFDNEDYFDRYPDARATGMDAFDHYAMLGIWEGRQLFSKLETRIARVNNNAIPLALPESEDEILAYLRRLAGTGAPAWNATPQENYALNNIRDLKTFYDTLADRQSQRLFLEVVKSIELGAPAWGSNSWFVKYSHPVVHLEPCERVVYCGASTDSTINIAEFLEQNGSLYCFGRRMAARFIDEFVQNPNNYFDSRELWRGSGLYFSGTRLPLDDSMVEERYLATDLDAWLEKRKLFCTTIILDMNGGELNALIGAENTLSAFHPKLMLSLNPGQGWLDLPLWLINKFPGYKFYLGCHGGSLSPVVIYAIYP